MTIAPMFVIPTLLATLQPPAAPPPSASPTTQTTPVDRWTYEADPGQPQLRILKNGTVEHTVTMGKCSASALLQYKGRLYVGCTEGQVRVYDLADPRAPKGVLLRKFAAPVEAFDTDIHSGSVHARVGGTRHLILGTPAEPEPQAPAAIGASPAAPQPPKPTARVAEVTKAPPPRPTFRPPPLAGRVIEERPAKRRVVVDIGRTDKLRKGDAVEFYRKLVIPMGPGETIIREETLAVGTAAEIAKDSSTIDVGLRERVFKGAYVRRARTEAKMTANRVAPPRIGDIWHLHSTVRPFLAWKAKGAGVLVDAGASYRFRLPLVAHVMAEPIGFGKASNGTLFAGGANGVFAFDSQFLEIGAGAGWTVIEGDWKDSALTIPQVLRIGAVDGLNVRVLNSFAVLDDKWSWGGTNGRVDVPMPGKIPWWLRASAGTGIAGYGYVDGAARVLVYGDGDGGSWFLNAGGGYAQIEGRGTGGPTRLGEREPEGFSHSGPMFSFGVEWRPGRSAASKKRDQTARRQIISAEQGEDPKH